MNIHSSLSLETTSMLVHKGLGRWNDVRTTETPHPPQQRGRADHWRPRQRGRARARQTERTLSDSIYVRLEERSTSMLEESRGLVVAWGQDGWRTDWKAQEGFLERGKCFRSWLGCRDTEHKFVKTHPSAHCGQVQFIVYNVTSQLNPSDKGLDHNFANLITKIFGFIHKKLSQILRKHDVAKRRS